MVLKQISSQHRRGMAVLLVLSVLAITLAVCYATLRGQGATTQLARNNSRSLQARQAAHSGLAAALRKMSDSTWGGVSSSLNAFVTDDSWYEVSFSTGDLALPNTHPEYPYRVRVEATGFAADPADPAIRAIHRSRCTVQLVRKAIAPEPTIWPKLTDSTVYQWGNRNVYLQEPVRINGLTTILGRIWLSTEYPLTPASRERYLQDLNAMRLAGRGDHRPVENLHVALARQDAATLLLLTTKLGLLPVDSLDSTLPPLTHPGAVTSYRLYPGGAAYEPPLLQQVYGNTLQDLTLLPSAANPLGVFRSSGALTIDDNVQITGTIISETTASDIQVIGENVAIQPIPAGLPKLHGSQVVYQLPAALVRDSLAIHPSSTVQLRGFTMVWDEFELKRGAPAQFTMQGNLATAGLLLKGRDTWMMTSTAWNNDYNDYMGNGSLIAILLEVLLNTIRNTLGLPAGAPVFFPEYMQHVRGFTVQPTLTFQPASGGVQPHWQDWSQPIYQKGASDEGLCWDVIRWEDYL
jgi:hypothetical protein